jgi:hypothetical protein
LKETNEETKYEPSTMEFERAAERLKKDHSKIQRRRPVATSAQAKLQAERAKQQRQQEAAEREKKRRQEEYITDYYRQCEREFMIRYFLGSFVLVRSQSCTFLRNRCSGGATVIERGTADTEGCIDSWRR